MSGWSYNQAKYFRAKNLLGDWEDMGDPCIGDDEHTECTGRKCTVSYGT